MASVTVDIEFNNLNLGRSIKTCGLCISGQTIKNFMAMVNAGVELNDYIILNVGSVDLLHGRSFIEMRQDFIDLYAELENRGIHTVTTTLAPLANTLYSKEIQMRWQQFNMFLLNNFSNVIDISCCFVSNTDRILFECYQPWVSYRLVDLFFFSIYFLFFFVRTPKYVSGSGQAHLLWNYVGRQRVLKHLKDSLAELAYRNSIFNNNF